MQFTTNLLIDVKDSHIQEIGNFILQYKKVVEHEWQEISFVFDVTDGHMANYGKLWLFIQ
ncbi:hypothetical protein [Microbulbifer rhizosphaerae]|uniref:Uncharacterized protein n=1 Tax=Microbulbifer rhizosphaerae TaxID=1562603 RepID=A0A7W4Z924_9GAMM|nr:hypothetical protein [Microbulbifer rhizosphaerae]MBB3059785.1 hypothetical protein [Microbulbifer rhizosphaerae]